MEHHQLVATLRTLTLKQGLTLSPRALEYLDRDWGIPPAIRAEAIAEVTKAVLEGAPESCREPDRIKFSTPNVVVFVALARPQPDRLEAMLVRPVRRRLP